jgi:lysozyme
MSIPADVYAILAPLIQRFEGCRLESYQDDAGVWTIGWGHTGADVGPGQSISQDQADALAQTDRAVHYAQLLAISPTLARASASRQAALTSFVYNEGIGRYQSSTLRSAVDCMAWTSVKAQLGRWIYAAGKVEPGLKARRQAEIELIDS